MTKKCIVCCIIITIVVTMVTLFPPGFISKVCFPALLHSDKCLWLQGEEDVDRIKKNL